MKTNHPNIILHYVPAGCTGVFQACDVGMQRIFKHSLKRSYHAEVVSDTLKQVKANVAKVEIDKRVEVWHDRSVQWLWDAYKTLNNEKIVKKVTTHLNILYFVQLIYLRCRHSKCAEQRDGTFHTAA
jgi:hypothetical protein